MSDLGLNCDNDGKDLKQKIINDAKNSFYSEASKYVFVDTVPLYWKKWSVSESRKPTGDSVDHRKKRSF